MIPSLTLAGTIHTALAMLCIVIGAIQLLRPKGGALHRARGYAFVYAMLLVDGAAMLVYRFTGQFNMFHVGAIVNFACIVLAMVPVLRSPRPDNWKLLHHHWIAWSYVGLMAAAATQLLLRMVPIATRGQGWAVSAVATALVSAIGYVLIDRYRPRSEAQTAEAAKVRHEGAT